MICIYVDKSKLHGLGAFAFNRIPNKSIVGAYFGEVIDREEAIKRDDTSYEKYSEYIVYISDNVFIDAKGYNYPLRFINHSLTPNCDIVISGGGALVKVIATVQKGEELTIDYGFEIPQ